MAGESLFRTAEDGTPNARGIYILSHFNSFSQISILYLIPNFSFSFSSHHQSLYHDLETPQWTSIIKQAEVEVEVVFCWKLFFTLQNDAQKCSDTSISYIQTTAFDFR
jgi:hypothetical protein